MNKNSKSMNTTRTSDLGRAVENIKATSSENHLRWRPLL